MLTTPTMEDEGSSLGTTESERMVPNENAAAVNGGEEYLSEVSLANEESEWRMVTDCFETQSLNGGEIANSGLLILDGEEPEAPAGGPKSGSDTGSGSGLDFSVPGADSVPTIVGSIDGLPAAAPTATPGFGEKTVPKKIDSSGGARKDDGQGTAPQIYNCKSRLALFLVPTLVLFLVPSIASIRLYRERNSLLVTVAQLEEEIQVIKEEAKKKKQEEALLWNTCGDGKETVLLDNCWLTAKANIELGDCASHVKDNILEFSSSLSERLALLGKMDSFAFANDSGESATRANRSEDSKGMFSEEQITRMKAMMAFWNATKGEPQEGDEPPTSNSDDWKSSFFSKMESSGKSQWKDTLKDAKSVFHTILKQPDLHL